MPDLAARSWPILDASDEQAALRVIRRGVLSGPEGPELRAFERELGEWLAGAHVVCTSSGTAALQATLLALDLPAGSEVLVPCYTFGATAMAVVNVGLRPRFVAIDPVTWNMDPEAAKAELGPHSSAILAVHMHGLPFDADRLLALADRAGIPLIEDAAQAHGASWRGRPCGTLGRAACFSLQSSKHIGVGEGGFVATADESLARRVREICGFGIRDGEAQVIDGVLAYREHHRIGGNHRLHELPAALGRAQLARLPDRLINLRDAVARLLAGLADLDGLILPHEPPPAQHAWHKIRIGVGPELIPSSVPPHVVLATLQARLAAHGIETTPWQAPILPLHPAFRPYAASEAWSTSPSQAAVARSLILFHEARPLIAQAPDFVEHVIPAFRSAWTEFVTHLPELT
jgi:dTDP-4-amino-4,6-dideoxygalactose transaminase